MKSPIIKENKYFNFSKTSFLMLTSKASYFKKIDNILTDLCLNKNRLAQINQVHSDNIFYAKGEGHYGEADGLISNISYNTILSIVTADCVPIFITDLHSGLFGLIHAGWRGIVKNIHVKAIKNLIKEGALVENISISLGPFIHPCCYEINNDITIKFDKKYLNYINNKIYLDLSCLIIDDFIKIGIKQKNIYNSNICTYENRDCCSFRKGGKEAGKMYSIITYIK